MANTDEDERLRRWRLILGGGESDGTGIALADLDLAIDQALQSVYDPRRSSGRGNASGRHGGLGSSAPMLARWLGDIRAYFPSSVVRVMQKDALTRLGLSQMLLEPELLQAVEPDINLVATLLTLSQVIPNKTKQTARMVVRRVVEDLERKLANPLRQAISGSLNRSMRNRRPRHNEINWDRTIRANLKHYQPAYQTIIPEVRIGYGRRTSALRDIILCLDQSGSMAASLVYSSIMAAVMASLRSVRTSLVVFDTSVVDLTHLLADPVDVLFGTQLGGGTDINRAVAYCQELVRRPSDTILVLISDLYEGGDKNELVRRVAGLAASGVQVITLLALDDRGAPAFNNHMAANFAAIDVPSFACTPDLFPDLMAAAIGRRDISQWAASNGIVTARPA
ncbi:MAG TPA: VWA domain-containing protein [Blastocatellia bacterium]|nr:VWA domain-containing protein [Blastocatellia bacterium]